MKATNSKLTEKARRRTAGRVAEPLVHRILVTTDFSAQSLPALHYALGLAGKTGAAVTLLHVVDTLSPLSGMESVVSAHSDSQVVKLAGTKLQALAQREKTNHRRVTTEVRRGQPLYEIIRAAGQVSADIIVIATHGHTGFKRVWLGSTAERVVRHAPCPVLTVPTRHLPRRTGPVSPFQLRKILVPIDFSSLSKDALPYATLLAGRFGAEIILIHVVPSFPIDYLLGAEITSQTVVPLMKQAEANLGRLGEELSKETRLKVSARVRVGSAYEEIVEAAQSEGADLIILTTHGYTGLKHAWLGSTAERVVRHALCPVLAVRE